MQDSLNESQQGAKGQHDQKESLLSFVIYLSVAMAIAFAIRFFLATPFIVSGSSMLDNFHNHDYLIIDRLTYRMSEPERGDVIVFELPQEHSRDLIKRIVALPNETIKITGNKPTITIINAQFPDGIELQEPHISPEHFGGPTNIRVTLGENEYFVMGDNRFVSSDSRYWGTLPRNNIIGRVLVRLFPFDAVSILPGKSTHSL